MLSLSSKNLRENFTKESTMDSEDSDKVPSGESEQVVKDSTINVTVDDLQPGIIVVSFSHKKSLYQGVLLQLDRNRGIPCGISFPKSFLHDSQKGEEAPPKEIITAEMPPLNKRQTYFQRDLLNDPTSAIAETHSKFPTLRRNIKPPARYKNSRMNLRVRNRPVLCAKCQILCEDKGPPPTNENGDEESAKKILSGVSTRRNQGKSSKSEESAGSLSLVDSISTTLGDDYKYSSYGQRGVVSNYWRRPNGMTDEKRSNGGMTLSGPGSSKSHLLQEPKICIKPISTVSISKRDVLPVTKMLRVDNAEQNILSDSNLPSWPLMPILSSSVDSSKMSCSSKKSRNLKLCISKLTMSKCDKNEPKIVTTLCKETERVTRSTAALIQENEGEQINLKIKDCNKNWNSRIRKRSTVPARFRDESYLTKNIFKFKRRRVDEKPGETGKLPIYTSRIVSSDTDGKKAKSSQGAEREESEGTGTELVCYSDTSGNASSSSGSSLNSSTSNGHGDVKNEPAKTPVIKITFGSSGNGIVVQIPPKTTQEESSGSPESKAARKAMKKAKKEARRKVSMSRETSPSPKSTVSPQSVQDTCPDSPLPPILNPEYPITPLNDESESILCDRGPPPVEPMEPLRYLPKRKKKEKKKKRSKISKENDLSSDNGANGQDAQRQSAQQESLEQSRILRNADPRPPSLPPLDDEQSFQCNKQRDLETENNHANHNEAHQRLFLSLKRLDENLYCKITCPTLVNINDAEENSDSSDISEVVLEPYHFPSHGYSEGSAESLDFYCHEETDHTYRKGDIVWAKLPECPWWPGKIEDILFTDADDVRAKIDWYKSEASSYIQFDSITPFAGTFDAMYTKQRNGGEYQEAVRDALLEAHEMSPKHIPAE